MLGESAGYDDQAPPQVAAHHEFLDEQSRHDRLAGARVVSQQEAQGPQWQHVAVDRLDLMRQNLDVAGLGGQVRVEQVRERDALRLGDQLEQRRIGVQRPRATAVGQFQVGLVGAVEDLAVHNTAAVLVCGKRAGPDPVGVDDSHQPGRGHATDPSALLQVLQPHHECRAYWLLVQGRPRSSHTACVSNVGVLSPAGRWVCRAP